MLWNNPSGILAWKKNHMCLCYEIFISRKSSFLASVPEFKSVPFFPCWVKYYSRSTPRTSDDFPSPKKRFFCCPSLRNLRGELVILELSACFLFRKTWINVPCIFCPFFFPSYPEGVLKGTKRDKLSARGDAHTDRSSQYYHDLVKFLLRKHFKTPRNSSNSSLDQDIASGEKSPKDIGLQRRIVLAESSLGKNMWS